MPLIYLLISVSDILSMFAFIYLFIYFYPPKTHEWNTVAVTIVFPTQSLKNSYKLTYVDWGVVWSKKQLWGVGSVAVDSGLFSTYPVHFSHTLFHDLFSVFFFNYLIAVFHFSYINLSFVAINKPAKPTNFSLHKVLFIIDIVI